MNIDRRVEPRGDDRRALPRYSIKALSAKMAESALTLTVTDIGETNIKLESVLGFPGLGEVVELSLSVPLLDKIVTVPIHGTVTRHADDDVVVNYSQPSKTWEHILSVLDRVCDH